jgi:hypothetical protein
VCAPTAQGASGWLVRRGSGSSPGQSTWDMSHSDRVVPDPLDFPLSLSFNHYVIFYFILNPHFAGKQPGRSLAALQQCHAVSEIMEHHGGKVHSLKQQVTSSWSYILQNSVSVFHYGCRQHCRSVVASAMCRSLVQGNLEECVHIIECGQGLALTVHTYSGWVDRVRMIQKEKTAEVSLLRSEVMRKG